MPRNTRNTQVEDEASSRSRKRTVANVNKLHSPRSKVKKSEKIGKKNGKVSTKQAAIEKATNQQVFPDQDSETEAYETEQMELMESPHNESAVNFAQAEIHDDQVVEMMVEDVDTSLANADEESDEEDGEIVLASAETEEKEC